MGRLSPLDAAKDGLRSDSGSKVGWKSPAQILGNPPQYSDPLLTAHSTSSYNFAGLDYDALVASATITLFGSVNTNPGPVVTNGVCDTSNQSNWGDGEYPGAPCSNYFPIIHALSDVKVDGGQGQGILIVDGNFAAKGPFHWYGIMIVQGNLKLGGAGTLAGDPKIWGTVFSLSKIGLKSKADTVSLSTYIGYSSCTLQKVLQAATVLSPMRSRSWVQLY